MEISENRDGQGLDFRVATDAYNNGDLKFAGQACEAILSDKIDHHGAYALMAQILVDQNHAPMARLAAMYAASLHPSESNLCILASCEIHAGRDEIAVEYLNQVLTRNHRHVVATRMMAEAMLRLFRFDEALDWANRALELDPDHFDARSPKGFALLHKRKWGEGWDNYAWGVGRQQFRDRHVYMRDGKEIPEWNGNSPGRLLVYAEQGLGDQLAFCSALVDPRVVEVVCDPKLANLLQRSLPGTVYGDQYAKTTNWEPRADHCISMSQMMQYRRRTAESFPRTPYLTPHPEKALMCRALLNSMGTRPKVGIAWTGGTPMAKAFGGRNLEPDDLRPILSLPYDFINLEYRDTPNIEGVHDLRWLHKTKDYDDTAALVSCLDAVVTVPTTAYHLAGGLGVKAFVIVHDKPHFHEGMTDKESPWWGSVEFIRRPEYGTAGAVAETAKRLETFINEQTDRKR